MLLDTQADICACREAYTTTGSSQMPCKAKVQPWQV
ncbi:hypothetical protein CGRA01v4_14416 [Colletotrichum graminicola]|nr:hypothetical protein CGRA01v4_14416 [Colletotrichum graminicola]